MDANGKNLICRNCLERKPIRKEQIKSEESKIQKQESSMKEYFCKACKYNFKRAKHLVIRTCPYCGSSGSIMVKGSTARIIADASKMKEDFRW
jgi:DNA-directed RNA polymerase subunit RPC12/RpoP